MNGVVLGHVRLERILEPREQFDSRHGVEAEVLEAEVKVNLSGLEAVGLRQGCAHVRFDLSSRYSHRARFYQTAESGAQVRVGVAGRRRSLGRGAQAESRLRRMRAPQPAEHP